MLAPGIQHIHVLSIAHQLAHALRRMPCRMIFQVVGAKADHQHIQRFLAIQHRGKQAAAVFVHIRLEG